jgi:serine/threonine protein phosphatase PrpC
MSALSALSAVACHLQHVADLEQNIANLRRQSDFLRAGMVDEYRQKILAVIGCNTSDESKEIFIDLNYTALYKDVNNPEFQNRDPEDQVRILEDRYRETCAQLQDYQIIKLFLEATKQDKKEVDELKHRFDIPEGKLIDRRLKRLTPRLRRKSAKLEEIYGKWEPRKIQPEIAYLKMLKNTLKTCLQVRGRLRHAQNIEELRESYASPAEATALLLTPAPANPLPPESIIFSSAMQGKRGAMEDAHFCIEDENKILAGVFDGHAGSGISDYASKNFCSIFETLLRSSGNVHEAFEAAFGQIQNDLSDQQLMGGSTAVVIYVDKATHLVYTATLGDSEANVYRVFNEKMKSIPLSCIRDWTSQKDAKRLACYHEIPELVKQLENSPNPKALRSGLRGLGVNVSRAFGDFNHAGTPEKPLVIAKPKITVNRLQEGDIVVLACDGLKDFVPEKEIIKIVQRSGGEDIAKELVNSALNAPWNSKDNVTVVAIKIPEVVHVHVS